MDTRNDGTYHNDGNFEPKVQGNERRDKSKDGFQQTHGGKADPIREPLGVFFGSLAGSSSISRIRVDAFEGHVGGIDKADEVDQEFGAAQNSQGGHEDGTGRHEKPRRGIARGILQALKKIWSVKNGVGYLMIVIFAVLFDVVDAARRMRTIINQSVLLWCFYVFNIVEHEMIFVNVKKRNEWVRQTNINRVQQASNKTQTKTNQERSNHSRNANPQDRACVSVGWKQQATQKHGQNKTLQAINHPNNVVSWRCFYFLHASTLE